MHGPAKLQSTPFLYFSLMCVIRFITKGSMLSFVFTWSDCHLTIITLHHCIKTYNELTYILLIDSLVTVHFNRKHIIYNWIIKRFGCNTRLKCFIGVVNISFFLSYNEVDLNVLIAKYNLVNLQL